MSKEGVAFGTGPQGWHGCSWELGGQVQLIDK